MELGEWLARGLRWTWQYKALWVFGFVAALGAGGTPSIQGRWNTGALPPGMPEAFERWLERNWPLVLLGILAGIGLSLFLQLIALWGQGALILGGGEAAEGRTPALGDLARRAAARWLRLIGIMVLLGVPGFLIALLLGGVAVGGFLLAAAQRMEAARAALAIATLLALLALLGCLLPLAGAVHLWSRLALRAALLEDLPWLQALRRGLQIGLRRIGPLLLVWLVLDLGVLGVTTFFLSTLTTIPLLVAGGVAGRALSGGGGPVAPAAIARFALAMALAALCLSGVTRLLLAPVLTFVETVWTLAYRAWSGAGARPPSG